ncbi:MAG: hypothetical protein R3305_09210 [Gammaproteobacteria bacterium]|nr:hypothetical protein [Gammaproteobacteria bacterium]
MNVKIVPESRESGCTESDYLRVSTCHSPLDDTVTLATIQRFVERQRPADVEGPKVRVKTLVSSAPMTRDQALGLATCYAERKQIPVVYTDGSGD